VTDDREGSGERDITHTSPSEEQDDDDETGEDSSASSVDSVVRENRSDFHEPEQSVIYCDSPIESTKWIDGTCVRNAPAPPMCVLLIAGMVFLVMIIFIVITW